MKVRNLHTKLPSYKPILKQIEWEVENESVTKNALFATGYFIFLKIEFEHKNFP